MGEGSKVEILARGNEIVIKKYIPSCIFCHSSEELVEYNGQKICRECAKKIAKTI